MKKIILSCLAVASVFSVTKAQILDKIKQDTTLKVSGSADLYYKYDFIAKAFKNGTPENSVVGMKQNSLEFGMVDLRIKKDIGKTSLFTELTFGARPYFNLVDPQLAYNVQNLYMSYQATKQLSFTGGIMYRYQTYERITPDDNYNYSNSFTYLNHYFMRSAGIKATYELMDGKVKLNAGLYNSYDAPNASNPTVASISYGLSDFVAQVFVTPVKQLKLSGAYWHEGQKVFGNHYNFQVHYDLDKKTYIGLDLTSYKCTDSVTANHSFTGISGYLQHKFCKSYTLGVRYENLQRTEPTTDQNTGVTDYTTKSFFSVFTITSSIKVGNIQFKQELKLDNTNKNNVNSFYLDKDGNQTFNGSELILAAIYHF